MKHEDDSFELYDLRVEVVGDRDSFVCSHRVGEYFEVVGENIFFTGTEKFSQFSLAALLPLLPAKQRITHKNDWMTTDGEIACPDPYCKARFKITRTKKRIFKHSETSVLPLNY